jgi:hypothetical protein
MTQVLISSNPLPDLGRPRLECLEKCKEKLEETSKKRQQVGRYWFRRSGPDVIGFDEVVKKNFK